MKRVCVAVLVCVVTIPAFAASRDGSDPVRRLSERLKQVVRIIKFLPQVSDVLSVPHP